MAKHCIQCKQNAIMINLHTVYCFFEILGLIDYLFSGQFASDSVAIEKACRHIAPSRRRV